MPGTYPAMEVSFAPGIGADSVPGALDWVDLSSRVVSVESMTGKEDPESDFGAGSATIVLDNSDGELDPDNTSGGWYGDLEPMTWFRVMGGALTATNGVFYGQVNVDGFQISAHQYASHTVTVQLVDLAEAVSLMRLPSSVYAVEVEADSPAAWWRLGESNGTVAADSSGNDQHGTWYEGATFNSRQALIGFDDNTAIEFTGREYLEVQDGGIANTEYTIEAWLQVPPVDSEAHGDDGSDPIYGQTWAGGSLGLQIQHRSLPNLGALYFFESGGNAVESSVRVDDNLVHHVVARRDAAGDMTVWVDNVDVTSGTATATSTPTLGTARVGRTPSAPVGWSAVIGTLDEVAVYNSAISDARVEAHYNAARTPWEGDTTDERAFRIVNAVGLDPALRSFDNGNPTTMPPASIGGSDVLSALQDVAKAERGDLYVDHNNTIQPVLVFESRRRRWLDWTSLATFGDGSGEVTCSEIVVQDAPITNYVTAQREGGHEIVRSDATSIARYRQRSRDETGLLVQTDAQVEDRADAGLAEGKDRRRRVRSIVLQPRGDDHPAWDEVFARSIADRITVKWRPSYGGTYTFPCHIEGIKHSYTERAGLTTTFFLSAAAFGAEGAPYWVWDTSTWETGDSTARWGF